MYQDGLLWIAQADNENKDRLCILPNMANRHGLVAGATGTGKTVTLKVLAEAFSDAGVPVFMSDVKGDISGMSQAGEDNEGMQKRIAKFGLGDCFKYQGFPTAFWDIFGEKGMPLRTTISEMGPTLLARLLELNDTQSDILTIIFKIADDNQLLLLDMKDLRKMIEYVTGNVKKFTADYGTMSKQSLGAISRSLIALENQGADHFFGEPALAISDWMRLSPEGKGYINLMDSTKLINYPQLYATFMLWLLSDLYETMPEVGDCEKPKMVFFFDEAHLLFKDAPKALLTKVEQVVKLVRSKGIGIFFCTQSPSDIPDEVLSQLGNRIQHALRAYTPADQKAVKAAANSFRVNPAFDTQEVLLQLGTGEALVSFLDEKGAPSVVEKAFILCPESRMGAATEEERQAVIKGDIYYTKYAEAVDRESAYEILDKRFREQQAAEEKAKEEAARKKEEEKERKEREKEEDRKRREKESRRRHPSAFEKGVNSAVTSIGREVTRSLLRGILDNLKR